MNYEPILKRWNSTSPSGRVDRSDALLLTFQPGRIADPPDEHRLPGFVNEGAAQELPRRTRFGAVAPIDILPGPYFLKQLRREMRRTDRSKSPLSVALLHVNGQPDDAAADIQELVALVHSNMRETDVLGYLVGTAIAVLLIETNEQGMQEFVRKIKDQVGDPGVTVTSATYPGQLFESLAAQTAQVSAVHPMFLKDTAHTKRLSQVVKRGVDILGAGVALALFAPVMLAAAVAVASTSPGPIVFRQIRLGKGGAPFVFYKFRSMYCDADDRIHREYVTSLIASAVAEQGGTEASKPWCKLQADPRITRIGRFMRKTSIDEMPQLFNVLKGDMSLIGPRPPIPYEAQKYQSWHLRRILEVKPGISGLWQVEAGGNTTFDDMVRMDLRYIRTWSLMLDFRILLKTVLVVLRRHGAG